MSHVRNFMRLIALIDREHTEVKDPGSWALAAQHWCRLRPLECYTAPPFSPSNVIFVNILRNHQ